MKRCRAMSAPVVVAAVFLWSVTVAAQELAQSVPFVPPPNSKALGRVDGTVRGTSTGDIELIAMTPLKDGPMTATAQPTLFWFLSARTERAATFSLRRHGSRTSAPIFECEVPGPIPAGVHNIKLGDYQVSLTSNVDYSWYVRLRDLAGTQPIAAITSYIVVPDLNGIGSLRDELAAASPEGRYKLYARRSFWYDALATIVNLLETVPASSDYRNRYVELLKDGGLDDVVSRGVTLPRAESMCSTKQRGQDAATTSPR